MTDTSAPTEPQELARPLRIAGTGSRLLQRDVGLALAAVALWSTVATGFKLGLAVFTPLQLVTLSVAIATVFFLALCLATGRLDESRLKKLISSGALGRAMGLGLLNPLLYYLVLFAAYDRLPAQIAQPVNYTWSITLALLAVPLLGQRLSRAQLAAMLLSYLGVLVIVLPAALATETTTSLSWFGVALALASTFVWAGYWLLNARDTGDAISMMAISFTTACPLLLLLCLLVDGWPALTPTSLAYATWTGLAEMGLAFLFWQLALRSTQRAAFLGQLIFLAPFVSLLLIHHVLGETVRASSVLGLGIIVAGLMWSTRLPAPDQPRPSDFN